MPTSNDEHPTTNRKQASVSSRSTLLLPSLVWGLCTVESAIESGHGRRFPGGRGIGAECHETCHRVEPSGSAFRLQASGFGVQGQGSGFRVQGSGFRVQGSGFRVQGRPGRGVSAECHETCHRFEPSGSAFSVEKDCSGFRVQGPGLRAQGLGLRVQGSGFRVQGSGLRVQVSGFRAQGSGFRAQGSGLRVQGSGLRVEG